MTEALQYKLPRQQKLNISKESCKRLLKFKSCDVNLNTISYVSDYFHDLEDLHLQHARKVISDMTCDSELNVNYPPSLRQRGPLLFRQDTNPISSAKSITAQTQDIVKWLENNFEEGATFSVPRCSVYNYYLDYCLTYGLDPINAASLGKMLRMVFPNVRSRRLGTRGQSKYHYSGIKIKGNVFHSSRLSRERTMPNLGVTDTLMPSKFESSICGVDPSGFELFEDLNVPQLDGAESTELSSAADSISCMISNVDKGLAADDRNRSCTQSSPPRLHNLPSVFPCTDGLRIPLHLKEKTGVFVLLYRHHCQRVLDAVVTANFSEVEDLLKTFWCTVPLHLQSLLLLPFTVDLILLFDLTLHRLIVSTLFPSLAQEMSAGLKTELRAFASGYKQWLEDALRVQPMLLKNKILEANYYFCNWLKRQTELCHMVSAADVILQNGCQVCQLHDDWFKLDLPSIARQCQWLLKDENTGRMGKNDEERLIQKYMVDFARLVSGGISVRHFLDWVSAIFHFATIKLREIDSIPKQEVASTLLLQCNLVIGVIIKELYVAQTFSIGTYHLLSLLFLDVVGHLTTETELSRKQEELKERLYFGISAQILPAVRDSLGFL